MLIKWDTFDRWTNNISRWCGWLMIVAVMQSRAASEITSKFPTIKTVGRLNRNHENRCLYWSHYNCCRIIYASAIKTIGSLKFYYQHRDPVIFWNKRINWFGLTTMYLLWMDYILSSGILLLPKWLQFGFICLRLIICGLMASYGDKDLSQHWLW